VIRHATEIAREVEAQAMFAYVDALADLDLSFPDQDGRCLIYVAKTPAQHEQQKERGRNTIRVPDVPLTRPGQVKIAVLLALYRKLIRPQDTIVFLSGIAGSGSLDTISVLRVGREFEMFLAPEAHQELPPGCAPDVLECVVTIAVELGREGREGRPVGALFVLGDTERVRSLSHQLILNPFRGYAAAQRNILDERLKETIKELATIDGAFLIREDGTIESAGTYLKMGMQSGGTLPQGLGARHHAAAAITDVSDAIAVAVSASTGTVTLFGKGRILAQIEKPRSGALSPARG
jgi:DNA integrity scanning protein DisA with diadenylate cyclase activity